MSQLTKFDLLHTSNAASTLTAAFAGNRETIPTSDIETVHLEVAYTPAAAQTDRYVELLIETSDDGTTFKPRSTVVDGNAYSAIYNHGIIRAPFNSAGVIATTGGTTYYFDFDFATASKYVRVSARESGAADFGTVLVEATLTHRQVR